MIYLGTLILYLFILISGTVLAYFISIEKNTYLKKILILSLFCVLFIPAAIRYEIGTDYINYYLKYSDIDSYNGELGYVLLNKLILNLDLPFQIIIIVMSFLTYYYFIKAFLLLPRKFSWLFVFMYITLLYLSTYSLIRQATAFSIMAYAILILFHGKKKLFIFYTLLAALFHKSVIIIFVIYILSLLPFPISLLILSLILVILCHILSPMTYLIINNYPSWLPYSNYTVENSYGYQFIRQGETHTSMGAWGAIVIMLIPLFFYKNIKNCNKARFFLLLSFGYSISRILALETHIFNRLSDLLCIFALISLSYFFSNIKITIIKMSLIIAIILFSLAIYFITATTAYSSLNSGLGVVPYKTIIEK
jgi:hypothetical protein